MESNRTRRAIKTPKRFDEEAFEVQKTGNYHHNKQEQKLTTGDTSTNSKASPKPSPKPEKSIIKIKLEPITKPREPKSTPKIKLRTPQVKLKVEPEIEEPDFDDDSDDDSEDNQRPIDRELEAERERERERERDRKRERELAKERERELARERDKEKEREKLLEKERKREREREKERAKAERDPDIKPVGGRPKTKRPLTPPVFVDLIPNIVLPFWDARTAAEEHEDDNVKELVHCHCAIGEELGLMVQCETCLTWQHAHCLGIENAEDAPDGYTCKACADPRSARESMKWAYDQDWLTKGRMKLFPGKQDPKIAEQSSNILYKINHLIENILLINKIIHSLKVKTRILRQAEDDDPELKLFKNMWPVNYQHRDGTLFIPSINHPSHTPASTISAIAEDAPDPADLDIETPLPEIGPLDVSDILDNTDLPLQTPMISTNSEEITPSDCRTNLRLHIQQTEEYLSIELGQIEEQCISLEKEIAESRKMSPEGQLELSSLKDDLITMKKYIFLKRRRVAQKD